jgi:hypothetical protein
MRALSTHRALAFGAAMSLSGASMAALLGILPGFPALVYDSTGTTSYSAASDMFAVAASPIAIRFTPTSPPRFVNPTGMPASEVLSINIEVNQLGILIGGNASEDLIVVGEVDADGDTIIDYAGTLLTGEVAGFGFADSGGTTDQYDFRFTVTGGALAGFFAGQDIGVTLTSENSDFGGSFTSSISGGAKGVLGPIPQLEDMGHGGCTPGYWKQQHHFDSWPAPYTPNTLFEAVFGRDVPGDPTLSEALRLNGGHLNALMRHATAALLNAASSQLAPDPAIDTPGEVILAFRAAFDSEDYETAKNQFEASNEIGCPLN